MPTHNRDGQTTWEGLLNRQVDLFECNSKVLTLSWDKEKEKICVRLFCWKEKAYIFKLYYSKLELSRARKKYMAEKKKLKHAATLARRELKNARR